MNDITTLLQSIKNKLRMNKIYIKREIFLHITQFLLSKQSYLIQNSNMQENILITQIRFVLQQIDMQLERASQLEFSSNLCIFAYDFLQLIILLFSILDHKDRNEINETRWAHAQRFFYSKIFASRDFAHYPLHRRKLTFSGSGVHTPSRGLTPGVFVSSFHKMAQELKEYMSVVLNENVRLLDNIRTDLATEVAERKKITNLYNTQFTNARKQLQEAQNLLATKSADILIRNYEDTAEEEKRKSRNLFWWGIVTIFIGILVVSFLFADCFNEITHSLSWEHFVFKTSIFIMFLIPAIYMLQKSAKREDHYFKLKDLSLQIRTIPNYLKDIPNEPVSRLSEKDKVRLELAQIIFGQNITTPTSSSLPDNTIEELIDLLKIALKGK